jgi:ketosteroid isomerase-like protein
MEEEIREATRALVTAVARGDAHAAGELYADRARLLAPTAEVIAGRPHIEAYWRTGISLGLTELSLEMRELQLAEAVAVEIGRFGFAVRGLDGPVLDRGTYLVLHRRGAGGSWERTVDVFNPDGPSVARPDRRERS